MNHSPAYVQEKDGERFRHIVFHGHPRMPVQRARPVNPSAAALVGARLLEREEAPPEPVIEFLHRVLARGGLRPHNYRVTPLVRRLPACLRALKVDSIEQAMRALRKAPELWDRALDALMIGVTSFYRDGDVFDALRRRVLPELVQVRPAPDVWSVACSDGAELLSMAALLCEVGAVPDGRLRGTDCRPSAIARARRGRYGASAMATMPATLRRQCFSESGGVFTPAGPLAAATFEWQVEDALAADSDDTSWDIILCRNLAIYLSATAVKALWLRLERQLRPGGVLVLGKAERPVGSSLLPVAPCIYWKPTLHLGR